MKDFPQDGRKLRLRSRRQRSLGVRPKSRGLWVTWLVLFLVAGFFVRQRVEYLRVERRIRTLMEQKQKLVSDILPLKLEESYLTRMGRIEGLAQQIGLRPAAEWQKFYLHEPDMGGGEPQSTAGQ